MAKSPFKMAGFSGFGNSPMKQDNKKPSVSDGTWEDLDKEDIVSYESPGEGYKKLKGTNIWEHTASKRNREILARANKSIEEQAAKTD